MLLLGASVEEQQMAVAKLVVLHLGRDDQAMVRLLGHDDQVAEQQAVAESRQIVLDQGSNSNLLELEWQIDKHLDYLECYSTDVYDLDT
ncbi:hypothetical protein ACT8ZR_02145 [Neobacillus sp. M.A.Huq-85]